MGGGRGEFSRISKLFYLSHYHGLREDISLADRLYGTISLCVWACC